MIWWNIVNTFIALAALVGVYFAWRQVHLIIQDRNEAKKRAAEENLWGEKFTLAIHHLGTIVPKFFTGVPGPPPTGSPGGNGYHLIFPELDVRQNIEAYLIRLDGSHLRMEPRSVSVEQLRLTVVRKTIQKVLDRIEETKKSNPVLSTRLGIV